MQWTQVDATANNSQLLLVLLLEGERRDEAQRGGLLLQLRDDVLRERELLPLAEHLAAQRREHPFDAPAHVQHLCVDRSSSTQCVKYYT